MKSRNEKPSSAVRGLIVGYMIAVMIVAAGILVITQLAIKDRIGKTGIDVSVAVIVAMSTIIGGLISKQNKVKTIYVMAVAILLIITMLIGGMLVDGPFMNLILRITVVLLSGIVSYIVCIKNKSNTQHRKNHYR